jgi:hypothetical protein
LLGARASDKDPGQNGQHDRRPRDSVKFVAHDCIRRSSRQFTPCGNFFLVPIGAVSSRWLPLTPFSSSGLVAVGRGYLRLPRVTRGCSPRVVMRHERIRGRRKKTRTRTRTRTRLRYASAARGGREGWGCTAVPPSQGRVYRAILILHPSHGKSRSVPTSQAGKGCSPRSTVHGPLFRGESPKSRGSSLKPQASGLRSQVWSVKGLKAFT